jgi:hypothetical protein
MLFPLAMHINSSMSCRHKRYSMPACRAIQSKLSQVLNAGGVNRLRLANIILRFTTTGRRTFSQPCLQVNSFEVLKMIRITSSKKHCGCLNWRETFKGKSIKMFLPNAGNVICGLDTFHGLSCTYKYAKCR